MAQIFFQEVPDPSKMAFRGKDPRNVTWQGREALQLNGDGPDLLFLPDLSLSKGRIEVDIGAEGTAYSGIVFRLRDMLNYELAYAQPHTSGKWDALQYDPVFHGSNTWQLYCGPDSQAVADIPLGDWFHFVVEFQNRHALIRLGDQPPLIVSRLAHDAADGNIGLWTYKTAVFSNLSVWDSPIDLPGLIPISETGSMPPGIIAEWFLESYGVVACEPSGMLNLNRYLTPDTAEVRLVRWLRAAEAAEWELDVGFSDEMILEWDGQVLFKGDNIWKDTPNRADRGYAERSHCVSRVVTEGLHRLSILLKRKEYFGFGLIVGVRGKGCELLPARFPV